MRRPVIAANWKMYKTAVESVLFVDELSVRGPFPEERDVFIAAPFLSLSALRSAIDKQRIPIALGAQNVHEEEEGAFTGEVSVRMLLEAGTQFVIVGHSERRQHFQESGVKIHKKIRRVIENSLVPLLCIGETERDRALGQTNAVLKKQLTEAVDGFDEGILHNLIIAYEPVWAIGTGLSATPEQAEEVHFYIRQCLSQQFSPDFASQIRILYGGSVKPHLMQLLMDKKNIDGVLVGGASLEVISFYDIIHYS